MLPEYDGLFNCSINPKLVFQISFNFANILLIYAGYNMELSKQEVPLIISGNPPSPSSLHTQLGCNDFTVPPRAIISGGGYHDEAFQELYQGCIKACGSKENLPVPFSRTSNELTDRLAAEGKGPAHASSEYPDVITERLKNKLKEAGIAPGIQEQRIDHGDEIFFFLNWISTKVLLYFSEL